MFKAKRSALVKHEKKLRPIRPARLVGGPSGASIRTRLRVSDRDAEVLLALGQHLGHLANLDLVQAQKGLGRRERKQILTKDSSSRYAGAITAETERRCKSEGTNQRRYHQSTLRAIAAITTRLDLEPAEGGYHNGAVRYQKQVRLRVLSARLIDLDADSSHLNIVRGGHRLWGNRAEIENVLRRQLAKTEDPAERQAAQDEATRARAAWRDRWDAVRSFIRALGSRDELDGNLTIRVNPISGRCSLLLPVALRHLANDNHGKHYILDARAIFSYRAQEWRDRTANAAITYTITRQPERKDRWYLDASWAYAGVDAGPTVSTEAASTRATSTEVIKSKVCTPASRPPGPILAHGRVLGVDFNADHLAAWILDEHGNPVGTPYRIPLLVKGLPTSVRDGHVRDAVSALLRIASQHHVTAIVCEDLGWSDTTGRDEATQGRVFRHLISGFPTTIFRDRLSAMASRAGVTVVAVDPAYTSKWGSAFWVRPTSTIKHITSGHAAAAIVIGRRGQCYRASRRIGVTSQDQSDLRKRATLQGYPGSDHQVQRILPRIAEQSVDLEHLIP